MRWFLRATVVAGAAAFALMGALTDAVAGGAGLDRGAEAGLALSRKYAEYRRQEVQGTWKEFEVLPTGGKKDEGKWAVVGGTLAIDEEGMHLQATDMLGCFATLKGRTFKGPVGIRYEATVPVGSEASDLSVRFGPANSERRVQFAVAAYQNTENVAILGNTRIRDLGGPKVVPGKWITVECMLSGGRAVGKLDGKVVMDVALPQPVTDATENEVALYVWGAQGTFRNVQMLKMEGDKAPAKALSEFVGNKTEDDLRALAKTAAAMLEDESYRNRDAATETLANLYPLSGPVILEATRRPDVETRERAETLARKLGLIEATKLPADARGRMLIRRMPVQLDEAPADE